MRIHELRSRVIGQLCLFRMVGVGVENAVSLEPRSRRTYGAAILRLLCGRPSQGGEYAPSRLSDLWKIIQEEVGAGLPNPEAGEERAQKQGLLILQNQWYASMRPRGC